MTTQETEQAEETKEPTPGERADVIKDQARDAFLAAKYAFVEMLREICETTGADPWDLLTALSYDDRIGWLPEPGEKAPERLDLTLYPFPRPHDGG